MIEEPQIICYDFYVIHQNMQQEKDINIFNYSRGRCILRQGMANVRSSYVS